MPEPQPTTRFVICPRCHGAGVLRGRYERGGFTSRDCPRCQGVGEIRVQAPPVPPTQPTES